jgi:hypothetical protein
MIGFHHKKRDPNADLPHQGILRERPNLAAQVKQEE